MRSSKFILIFFLFTIAVLSSCSPPTFPSDRFLPWDTTLTASEIKAMAIWGVTTDSGHTRPLELVPGDWPKAVFVFFTDTAGKYYRLPEHIVPNWQLLSVSPAEAVTITGYKIGSKTPLFRSRDGYTVGQLVLIKAQAIPDREIIAKVFVKFDGVLFRESFPVIVLNK